MLSLLLLLVLEAVLWLLLARWQDYWCQQGCGGKVIVGKAVVVVGKAVVVCDVGKTIVIGNNVMVVVVVMGKAMVVIDDSVRETWRCS